MACKFATSKQQNSKGPYYTQTPTPQTLSLKTHQSRLQNPNLRRKNEPRTRPHKILGLGTHLLSTPNAEIGLGFWGLMLLKAVGLFGLRACRRSGLWGSGVRAFGVWGCLVPKPLENEGSISIINYAEIPYKALQT